MASFVIDTPSYNQVTMKKLKNAIIPKEVIETTYTEMDWKTNMDQIRQSVIDQCTRISKNLIEASEKKQKTQFEEFKKIAESTLHDIQKQTSSIVQDQMRYIITQSEERIAKSEEKLIHH